MHPLEKIIIFLVACQVLQTGYAVWHVHMLHGGARWRYAAKMAPLALMTIALLILVARIFQLIPYVGV